MAGAPVVVDAIIKMTTKICDPLATLRFMIAIAGKRLVDSCTQWVSTINEPVRLGGC